MPITPNIDNATIFLACLGNGNNSYRWLNGTTTDGEVDMLYRLPSTGVNLSGTLWKAVPSTIISGAYLLQSLGNIQDQSYQYLAGTSSGSVALASNPKDKSANWLLQVVANPDDFYPHQPWGPQAQQSYSFHLTNVAGGTYLNGNTHDGTVRLTSSTSESGSNWLVLVAAWG